MTLALGTVLIVASAHAQGSSAGAGIALFDEGVRAMKEGKYAEACPKLARSQELAPSGGTLLALADCYEKNGQVASSWITFKEVATRARSAGKVDAEHFALAAARRLEPRVAWLTVNVRSLGQDAPEIRRGGRLMPAAEWGVPVPLDPGPQALEARGPGRMPWSTTIAIPSRGARLVVDVPELAREAPAPPAAIRPEGSGPDHGARQRGIGLAVVGVGVAGVAVGVVFGLRAASKDGEATKHCRTDVFCDSSGVQLGEEAHAAATLSTLSFIAGSAALAAGVILYVTAPRGASTTQGLRVKLDRDGIAAATSF